MINPKVLEERKRAIEKRLEGRKMNFSGAPEFSARNIQFEIADRTQAISDGGIGLIHRLVQEVGLPEAINSRVSLLKIYMPYRESDHVLNIAYNAMCGGRVLEDIELRRNDEMFLNALGADRIPDPTTAGDFCRRFNTRYEIGRLMDAIDESRLKVWAKQPKAFFKQAIVDMDGHLVGTTGECKEGMDIAYNGTWGYHPLIVSLANTGEVLSMENRPGNRPSHERAFVHCDRAIGLCRRAGFESVLLRGDTDFSQTEHLDRWDADGVLFHFGYNATPNLKELAENLEESCWQKLERPARYEVQTQPRSRPGNVKQAIVREREFDVLNLQSEEVAEFDYRPTKCKKTYRMIVVRKNISHEKGEIRLFDEIRYFFYITNDRDSTPAEVVFSCNDRCHQENLVEQLKNGVPAMRAAVDNLLSNWAYMVMTALAWNLKAWAALWLPENGRWAQKHRREKQRVLRMEFRTFVNHFIKIPCQIVRTGRRIVYRLLTWKPYLPVFRRLAVELNC
jgi:hypothetical protein